MNRVWTEEELDILRQDRAAKIPIPVTAAKLGRPVPATYARARLIGTLVQPHQPWDEASVARLRELVLMDPPMTDKRIAADLGRTVTQIRWKLQDLGLIGVRDLSKLAKVTASETARPKTGRPPDPKPPLRPQSVARVETVRQEPAPQRITPAQAEPAQVAPRKPDMQELIGKALKKVEASLQERLKSLVSASEAGMVQAAMEAIAEKGRMDQRLAVLLKKASTPEPATIKPIQDGPRKVEPKEVDPKKVPPKNEQKPAAKTKAEVAPKRGTGQPVPPKPSIKKAVTPASHGIAQAAPLRHTPQVEEQQAPKIVVLEAPAAARQPEPEQGSAQVSGRGGWKSVRRDPARVAAQSKAKAVNRSDAVDLALAAQAAIERFIAERGVTRTETNGIQTLVSRLQARGYIVVREGEGWIVDQRHRLENEDALTAFADARGIRLDIAA